MKTGVISRTSNVETVAELLLHVFWSFDMLSQVALCASDVPGRGHCQAEGMGGFLPLSTYFCCTFRPSHSALMRQWLRRKPIWILFFVFAAIAGIIIVLDTDFEPEYYSTLETDASAAVEVRNVFAHRAGTPLVVACYMSYTRNAQELLDDLAFLTKILVRATGLPVVAATASLPVLEQWRQADIIYVGSFGRPDRGLLKLFAEQRKLTVYIVSENAHWKSNPKYPWFDMHCMQDVGVSFGSRRGIVSYPLSNYMRMPWWMSVALRKDQHCTFLDSLYDEARRTPAQVARAWRARTGLALLLSHHYSHPRPTLYELMGKFGHVDCPSSAFHNMEWPKDLQNKHETGKVQLLRRYRYNIAPENDRSYREGGYNTEKVVQCLLGGTIPVYWGDTPFEPQVFNERRILQYLDGQNRSITDTVGQLERDAQFRLKWFSEPVLVPEAEAWLSRWCTDAENLLREALGKAAKQQSASVNDFQQRVTPRKGKPTIHIPGNITVQKGNRIAFGVTTHSSFYLSFDMQILETVPYWTSVLHFTDRSADDNMRLPSVFIRPFSRALEVLCHPPLPALPSTILPCPPLLCRAMPCPVAVRAWASSPVLRSCAVPCPVAVGAWTTSPILRPDGTWRVA